MEIHSRVVNSLDELQAKLIQSANSHDESPSSATSVMRKVETRRWMEKGFDETKANEKGFPFAIDVSPRPPSDQDAPPGTQ